MDELRWGLLAYGKIARTMEKSLLAAQGHKLHAIASHSNYDQIPRSYRRYKDYAALLADPEIDIVYVCTTHNSHEAYSIEALKAGKHVLCEKPMSTSEASSKRMIDEAQSRGLFLMEAIWMRYLPGYRSVKDLINSGAIGRPQLIQANFGFCMDPTSPKPRLLNPELAAGAVWDVGIYPIALALDLMDAPVTDIYARGQLTPLGVEDRAFIQLGFGPGKSAQLTCAVNLATVNQAIITGDQGHIIMWDFWRCEYFTLHQGEHQTEHHHPMTSTGLYHEIVACGDLIRQGHIQSPIISWNDTLATASIMDEILRQLKSN